MFEDEEVQMGAGGDREVVEIPGMDPIDITDFQPEEKAHFLAMAAKVGIICTWALISYQKS